MTTRDPYFDDGLMPARQTATFCAATRRLLERWELLVAKYTQMSGERHRTPTPEILTVMGTHEYWEGETERHLLLVAVCNVLKAIKLLDDPPTVAPDVARELIQARDLNEHWDENMPVFHQSPRPRSPGRPSGKAFAALNPWAGPYDWFAWSGNVGPLVTPHVSATQVHQLVDDALGVVRLTHPAMADEVPAAALRPWYEPEKPGDMWWPKLPQPPQAAPTRSSGSIGTTQP